MNSTYLYSNQQIVIPPLRLPETPQASQETIKIPPFPTRSAPQLTGCKRLGPHFFEQNIMREPIPPKKIKMASYNMLSRVSFSERDPFWPEGYPTGKANPQKVKVPSLNYQRLTPKNSSGKTVTINISTRKNETLPCLPKLMSTSSKENSRMVERPCSRQAQMKVPSSGNSLNELREPIYNIICQKLEENCLTLFESMKDLLILRQQFGPRNARIPSFDRGLEETMPGTPCTASEGKSEEGFNSETKAVKSEGVEIQVKQEDEDMPSGTRRTFSGKKANVIVLHNENKGPGSQANVRP